MPHSHSFGCDYKRVCRYPLVVGALALGALSFATPDLQAADELSSDDAAFFKAHFGDVIKIEPVLLGDAAVATVFAAPLYQLKVAIDDGSGGETRTSVIVARVDEKLVSIGTPSTDGDQPQIQKLIRPSFALRSDSDAKTFQAALDAVFPILMEDDRKAAGFTRAGNTWSFSRGKFFDSKMGFAVTTDASGAIVGVSYAMRLP